MERIRSFHVVSRVMRENKNRTNGESTTRVCNVYMRLDLREERMEEGKEKGGDTCLQE